ncbi:MAG: biopolymer transporter ExbD [Porphyromonadaceae bacterium]|nr:MAG: biopolymer transporter ExbD [Porphyromonadaceae bacterium]
MARKKRKFPQIASASLADIAFLLIIFFIVSTTMDVDTGIYRLLPQWVDNVEAPKINKRNTFVVLINKNNDLQIGGRFAQISDIKDRLKEFILNPQDNPNLSEKKEEVIEGIGPFMRSQGIVSLQNDRGTDYGAYMQVQNELVRGINELRDEYAAQRFGMKMNKLSEAQQEAVKKAFPTAISEAEPQEIK